MPYLKDIDRAKYENDMFPDKIDSAGELNYLVTGLIQVYLDDKVVNYAAYNAVIGALECCKLEVYRRLVAPYEDKKCKENGDVYL